MLTARENFIRFFQKKDYDWTPTSLDMLEFKPALIPDNIARGFVDQQNPYTGDFGGKDGFGVDWVYDPVIKGSMDLNPPFEDVCDWEKYVKLPDLATLDWAGCAEENKEYLKTDKLIHSSLYSGYFERLISLVGFENAAMALIDEEQTPYVHALFDKLDEYHIDYIRRHKEYFNVECMEVHDDWGSQNSLLMSVDTHREMIMPHFRRIADAAHEMGVYIELHSCGKIEPMFPNIMETKVDTWRGQAICDRHSLVDTYGDEFRFAAFVGAYGIESVSDDDEALEYAKKACAEWQGKDVWLFILYNFTQKQKEMIDAYIKSCGRI